MESVRSSQPCISMNFCTESCEIVKEPYIYDAHTEWGFVISPVFADSIVFKWIFFSFLQMGSWGGEGKWGHRSCIFCGRRKCRATNQEK